MPDAVRGVEPPDIEDDLLFVRRGADDIAGGVDDLCRPSPQLLYPVTRKAGVRGHHLVRGESVELAVKHTVPEATEEGSGNRRKAAHVPCTKWENDGKHAHVDAMPCRAAQSAPMGIVDEDIQVEAANLPDVGVANALIVEDPGARKRPRFPPALPKQHDLDPAEIHVEILFKERAFGHGIDEKKYLVRSAEMLRHDERALFATPEGPHVLIVDADLERYVRIPFDQIGCHASRSMRWRIRRRRLPVKEISAFVFRCHAGFSFLILR